ncbi:TPA: hypothetical protein L3M38_003738 [Clostridioides difficile]|nr:hypothetical protein [Clostridioides difficile]
MARNGPSPRKTIPACQHDGADETHAARDHHDEQQADVHFARRRERAADEQRRIAGQEQERD